MEQNIKDNFLKKANEIHNNKYDYSFVEYKNNRTQIKIICPIHGESWQLPLNHLKSKGCKHCGHDFMGKNVITTNKQFIEKSIKMFGNKYSYDKLVIVSSKKGKVIITCNQHGDFKITTAHHFDSQGGCRKCAGTYNRTNEELIEEFKKIHNNFYDYSLVNYKMVFDKIKIICPKHGTFTQTCMNHLRASGCPKCNTSKGEKAIISYFDKKQIKYIQEKSFDDCRSAKNYKLRFDFWVPDYNTLIEYDGAQHNKNVKYWGGKDTLIIRQNNDKIKNQYCFNNCIDLLRINYSDKNKIEEILNNCLINHDPLLTIL